MSAKRIAIIGAGISGIAAVKACREQGFTSIVCYERTDHICGLWRYSEDDDNDVDGNAMIMKTLVSNTSKEMTAYSDIPVPEDYPNFMVNSYMSKYLQHCADSISFDKYVKFKHQVITCRPNLDYDLTGQWSLTVMDLVSGQVFTDICSGVMVCTGLNNRPVMPEFTDQHRFKGQIIHSRNYRKPSAVYENRTVVVVGIGNSGGDIAVELSTVAKKLYLSTRSGSWIVRRVGFRGQPFDTQFHRRVLNTIIGLTPYRMQCYFGELYVNTKFNHRLYDLKPDHRLFAQHPMVNDDLPNRILSGFVTVRPDIDRFTENGVIFKGDTDVTPCDTVVMATGYELSYPFIPGSVLPITKANFNLYKNVFYPHLKHAHTLAIIGCVQPNGAIPPLAELQTRWFCRLMAGELQLPTADKMLKDIKRKNRWIRKRFHSPERHSLEVHWIPYMDQLAAILGVKPKLFKYFFTDPVLWWHLFFGPCVPYQYRLNGPNSQFKQSRQLIVTVDQRIRAPLSTRTRPKKL
ncbi:flavin-containing monooxygenase 5-like [Oppia nitens]|uniref:flavin-containing monooxygenase 5-like n=1 Tax=Oppia nitens TaxID=1686743 RepID=UPI0023D9ADB4|nr:flavin-containing monooxygenase 5-like [Oppia nitens]